MQYAGSHAYPVPLISVHNALLVCEHSYVAVVAVCLLFVTASGPAAALSQT